LLKQLNARFPEKAFVVIEHNMEFVMSLCHRIMVMVEGQVMAVGTPAEIRANQAVLDAYLGN
jgi:branched-chain amino acid transport system ATP-binding protein